MMFPLLIIGLWMGNIIHRQGKDEKLHTYDSNNVLG
jgi:hypothetical protein